MNDIKGDIQQLKATLSITEVARTLGIQVKGGKFRCLYPTRHANGDRTPSVSISESRGYFNCWVCADMRGDVIELVQKARACTFFEALNWLKTEFSLTSGVDTKVFLKTEAHEDLFQPKKGPDVDTELKNQVIEAFLSYLIPVENTPAARYLSKRRIYKVSWDSMKIRYISNYGELNQKLIQEFGLDLLKQTGLYNDKGNLRYYKHPLIFPYYDQNHRALFFQARAIDSAVFPKELNLKGEIPYPYNVRLLNQKPGWIYLCEGVIDTLTLLGRNMDAVGIPGVKAFKLQWLPYFKEKKIVLSFDQDEPGKEATKYMQKVFDAAGIQSVEFGYGIHDERFKMKEGQDVNDWFTQG